MKQAAVMLVALFVAAACSGARSASEVASLPVIEVPAFEPSPIESGENVEGLGDSSTAIGLATRPEGRIVVFDRSDRHLYTVTTEGTELTRISETSLDPALSGFVLSPSGDRLVAIREIDHLNDGLNVVNLNGSETSLSTREYTNKHPRWSPDGQSVTYENLQDGLFVARADGTDERTLANFGSYENHSRSPWLHDGSAVAYQRVSHLGYQIVLLSTDGGPERVVLESNRVTKYALSPSKPFMVFTELVERYGDEGATFLLDLDSGDRVQLTNLPGKDRLPTWSPDGERIAFFHIPLDGAMTLRVMNADGSDMRVLFEGRMLTSHPIWAPTADAMLFVYEDPDSFQLVTALVDLDGNVFDLDQTDIIVGWLGP